MTTLETGMILAAFSAILAFGAFVATKLFGHEQKIKVIMEFLFGNQNIPEVARDSLTRKVSKLEEKLGKVDSNIEELKSLQQSKKG